MNMIADIIHKLDKIPLTYYSLATLTGMWIYCGDMLLYIGAVRATSHMHHAMVVECLRYPMTFFETSLKGQMLNRFGKDVNEMDTKMGENMRTMLLVATKYIRTIAVICAVLPLFTIVILPLSLVFSVMQVLIIALGFYMHVSVL